MYPAHFIDELKSKIHLSEVVSKKVALKSRGKDFVGLCPFHNEKTPSFSVNDIKGFYYCFGCSAHGDIITFVMETEGLQFKEAVEKLANDFGITLPKLEKSAQADTAKKEIDTLFEINEETCRFFEGNIFKPYGKAGLIYSQTRALTPDDLKRFRVGFAFDDFNYLKNHLSSLGFSEDDMLKAGVIVNKNGKIYDKFRNRLMFPVIDKRGRVIAFTGRAIDNEMMPKYMNSPETKIYHKSNVLFNLFFARKAIYNEKFAVLVEGNLDALSLAISGIENVVAPMGTAVTESQLLDLWKNTSDIVVCLDGDTAGKKASVRISQLVLPLINADRSLKFAFMPDGKDPDVFVRERGKNALIRLFEKALPLSEFIWYSETKKLGIEDFENANPELKVKLENNLLQIVDKIQDGFSQRHFRDFYKKKLWAFKQKKKKIASSKLKPVFYDVVENHTIKKVEEAVEKCEYQICLLLVQFPSLVTKLFKKYNVDISSLNFKKRDLTVILDILENFEESIYDLKDLEKRLEKHGLNDYLKYNRIFLNHCSNSLDENGALTRLYRIVLERDIALVEIDLKETATKNEDLEKIKILQAQLTKLRRKKSKFDNESSFV